MSKESKHYAEQQVREALATIGAEQKAEREQRLKALKGHPGWEALQKDRQYRRLDARWKALLKQHDDPVAAMNTGRGLRIWKVSTALRVRYGVPDGPPPSPEQVTKLVNSAKVYGGMLASAVRNNHADPETRLRELGGRVKEIREAAKACLTAGCTVPPLPEPKNEDPEEELERWERWCISAGQGAEDLPPLTPSAAAVYEMLLSLPAHRAMMGPQILDKLSQEHTIEIDQSTLTGRIIPALKPYGVEGVHKVGYRVKPSRRPRA